MLRDHSFPGARMLAKVARLIRVEPPGHIEHLLLRAVLGCVVGVEIVNDIARCLTLDDYPLLGSYLHSSADTVLNIGKTIAERDSTTLIPMLRLQLECLIYCRWILSSDKRMRQVRALRVMLKSAQETQRSQDSDVAQVGRDIAADAERQAHDFGVQHLSPAPSVRRMAEEIGELSLYEEFRELSAGAHAGFGVIAELYRSSEAPAETRVYKAILALENLARLFNALSILCRPEQKEVFESILHTFRPEYVDRLRDAFFSHVIATARTMNGNQLTAELKQEGLQCRNFWRLEISKRQSNSPDQANWPEGMPLVGAADAVRGLLGPSFSILSLRFRNHGPGMVHISNMALECRGVFGRTVWRRCLEDFDGSHSLNLVENESGFVTFKTRKREGREVSILCGQARRKFAVTVSDYAARQNVSSDDAAIDIVTLRFRIQSAIGEPMTLIQPLVVC